MNIIKTNNLTLRHFHLGDAEFAMRLVNSPGWLQFIGDREVYSLEDAERYLSGLIYRYSTQGFGFYLVEMTETQEAIGMCGLIHREGLENADIGFAFLPEYEGKGYGFEAAKATLQYAKTVLALPKILAITLAENVRCIRLLEKLGMRYEKVVQMPNDSDELQLYAISFA